eukprot:m51a1_g6068 hypothetical protein (249) ;mRNA; r:269886-270758
MSPAALVTVFLLAALSHARLCANQVGSGCSIWTPGTTSDSGCHLHTVVARHQIVEARVPDNQYSTNYALVASDHPGLHLLGNVTTGRDADCAHLVVCPRTRVFFFEAAASGRISVDAVSLHLPQRRTQVFALGVLVGMTTQEPVCSGGFFGSESNGNTVTVERNALVEVRLQASSASAGYKWVADPATPAVAEIELPCSDPQLMGCPQTYVFFFRATQEGQVRINGVQYGTMQVLYDFNINLQFPRSA